MSRKTYLMSLALAALGLTAATSGSEAAEDRAPEQVRADEVLDNPAAEEAERERRIRARTERAKREAEFNQLDGDGDGYLSKAELSAKKDLAPGPDVLDRDDDGLVSRTEFAAVETSSVGPDPSGGP